jgi:hypothetical protein
MTQSDGLHWWDVPALQANYWSLLGGGAVGWIRAHTTGLPFARCVSIGSGSGRKEIELIRSGVCRFVDGYDLDRRRVAEANAMAEKLGLESCARFHVGSWPDVKQRPQLVYWDMALHHMPHVGEALAWSVEAAPHVCVVEYCGPNRLQYTPAQVAAANGARAGFPAAWGAASRLWLPTLDAVLRNDTTEAVDSEAIPEACGRLASDYRPLGGLVYAVAMRGLYGALSGLAVPDADLTYWLGVDRETASDPRINLHGAWWLNR